MDALSTRATLALTTFARYVFPDECSSLSSRSLFQNALPLDLDFISNGEASLQIFAHGNIDHSWLQRVLSGFGDLCNFTCVNEFGKVRS